MSLSDLFPMSFHRRPPVLPKLHLAQRLALWRSRRQLAQLDERALRDIGITSSDARREAARSLWDAPPNWLGR